MEHFAMLTPKDIQPKTSTAFDTMNKIRRGWVSILRGGIDGLEIVGQHSKNYLRLSSYPTEERFEIYKDIDASIHKVYVHLLKARREEILKMGGNSDVSIAGRRIVQKGYQFDTDEVLCCAIEHVMAKLVIEYYVEQFNQQ